MSAVSPGLELRAIRIAHRGRLLVALDATVGPGETLTLMGPSGSGKSSLLAYVAGFLDPDLSGEGRVVLDGRDVTVLPPERRRMGLLFQDALLLPHLSVAGNLLFGLTPEVRGRAARLEAVDTALAEVGMDGMGGRDPATLSGGEAARVALMRTLLARPQALLLDEPFSRLDAELRAQVRSLVFEESRKRRLPVLLVTHDAADAEAAGGPVVALRAGENA
jgi:putative thiamine transport system ATP-binding protein